MALFRVFKNPFITYIVAFASVLALYHAGWSEIYPPLSWSMLLFFAVTFVVAGLLARAVVPLVAGGDYQPGLLPGWAVIFVVVTFAGEVYLMGGVPLVLVMHGARFFKLEAQVTHLHVFTLWSVFSTIRFADFLYSARPIRYRYLAEAVLVVVIYTVMIYRGPAIMTLASWAFLTIIRFNGLRLKYFAMILATTAVVVYVNGALGDIRSPGQEAAGAPSVALQEMAADMPAPLASAPRRAFWGYLYATVPLANFQNAVDKMDRREGTLSEFVVTEMIPDTFSRRIMPLINPTIESNRGVFITRDQLYPWSLPLVSEGLNTATMFGRAYGYLGWLGAATMFAVLATFSIAYLIVISYSPYRVPALALLNTLVLFCLINNMLASAAMIPQLVWPLVLSLWPMRIEGRRKMRQLL